MAEKKFKVGDRVKAEFEGVYDGEGGKAGAYLKVGDKGAYVPELSALTLIERAVEPLAPGSVVRNKRGTIWLVEEAGRVYTRDATGYGFRSSHNPLTLARAVRDENDLTLIYDGSNK